MKSIVRRVFILVGIVLIALIAQSRSGNITSHVSGVIGNVVNPLIYNVNFVSSGLSSFWNDYILLVNTKKKFLEYENTIQNLTLENSHLKQILRYKEEYQELDNLAYTLPYSSITAKIVGRDIKGFVKYFIVNKGSSSGVSEGDTVIGPYGLVGRIGSVMKSTSKVYTILDSRTYVSVKNLRTGGLGLLHGNGNGGLSVEYYDNLDNPSISDALATSGYSGVYIENIDVAKISSINKREFNLFQDVGATTYTNFNKLNYVLIISKY